MVQLPDRFLSELGDRYVIERQIGHGGMGAVWLARDVRHDRPVALKTMHAGLDDSASAERFTREIAIVARLVHPHILPLFDSGVAAGRAWFVMPFIDGESLRDRLRREGRLPPDDALRIAAEVADALEYAHRQGIVHRDVKPENVLLAGHALVADFGIARAAVQGTGKAALTAPGLGLGTLDYASPEQFLGDAVDGRSDVYGLACTTYEMLTGAPPFRAATAHQSLALRVSGADLALTALGSDGARLAVVLKRALSVNPADRQDSPRRFVEELVAAREGSTNGVPSRVASGGDRDPYLVVIPFSPVGRSEDIEVFCDGITDELIHALTGVPGLRVAARAASFALKGLAGDLRQVAQQLDVHLGLHGSVRQAGARVRVTAQLVDLDTGTQQWSAAYDRDLEDVLAIQEQIATEIVARLRGQLGAGPRFQIAQRHSANPDAYAAYLRGRYYWNRRPRETAKGLASFEQAIALDPSYALAHAGLADCYATLGSWEAGAMAPASAFPRALAAARRAIALAPSLAEPYASLAYADVHYSWNPGQARQQFEEAIRLDPGYAHAHHWQSHLLLPLGLRDESLAASLRALRLEPLDTILNVHLAWHHHFAGDYDATLEQGQRTLALDADDFWSRYFMGLSCEQQGRHGESLRLLREALERSGESTVMLSALGHVLAASGDAAGARAVVRDLEERARTTYVSPYERGLLHAALGETEVALAFLRQACLVRDGWMWYANIDPRGHAFTRLPEARAIISEVLAAEAATGALPPPGVSVRP